MMKINNEHKLKNSIWLIFILGLSLTSLATYYIYSNGVKEYNLHFEIESEDILENIRKRLQRYEHALIQARAFLMQAEKLNYQSFQEYLENTELMDRYPGMQGLAYVQRFSHPELESHLKERRKESSSYKVWPEVKEGEITSIVYIAPANWRNLRALGFNMMSEPIRREAMEKARDSGRPTLSRKLKLVQETGKNPQPGFILFVPIYGKEIPETLEKRRQQLSGYVSSPFRVHDLISAIFHNDQNPRIDFAIYDGEAHPENLLYIQNSSHSKDHDQSSLNKKGVSKELNLFGNKYQVLFSAGPAFRPPSTHSSPILVAILGLLVTLLLMRIFFITHRQVELTKLSLEARDEFLSIASHELKTPITSLQLQLQMTRRSVNHDRGVALPPQKLVKVLDNSIYQVNRITRLIDDLLEISRIEKGKISFIFEEFNIAELIRETFESHAEQIKAAENKVEFELDEELRAECDRFRIEQVITNLLTNSIKYGAGTLITVKLWRKSETFILSISDKGQGIPVKFQQIIFERFERAGFSRSISGLGLGLYISKQIITAHHGDIQVQSQEGEGAEFVVELPLRQNNQAPA